MNIRIEMGEFRGRGFAVLCAAVCLLYCTVLLAEGGTSAAISDEESRISDPKFYLVIDKITAREAAFVKNLREYMPMVETYIQKMRPDKDFGAVPISDEYFLGRVKLEQDVEDQSFLATEKKESDSGDSETKESERCTLCRIFGGMRKMSQSKGSGGKKTQTGGFMADGFAQMILIDATTFDREHYEFRFVRREFLGDVLTVVIDVKPKPQRAGSKVLFIGRLWAEDQQYNIVRFNGTYTPQPEHGEYIHFDSWREEMGGGGQWLPAHVYSEETDLTRGKDHRNFRAQTLLWGYDFSRLTHDSEFAETQVESSEEVRDQTDPKQDPTTVSAELAWQRQAEDNILDRMQRAALLAPEGDVDKVLDTVLQTIEVTNNIEVEPEMRCRVLLTQPMESFTVGRTIVVSRGLLDALPDEASLAIIIAREMGHILSGHQLSEKYAFSDLMIFPEASTIENIKVKRTPEEEKEADEIAVHLLQNSPYKDKLASAAPFLAAMHAEVPHLPNLIKGEFGTQLYSQEDGTRMGGLTASAPQLPSSDVKPIAALPLGGRIKLNPWSNQLTIQKTKPKMPFQITPMFPYLTRQVDYPRELPPPELWVLPENHPW